MTQNTRNCTGFVAQESKSALPLPLPGASAAGAVAEDAESSEEDPSRESEAGVEAAAAPAVFRWTCRGGFCFVLFGLLFFGRCGGERGGGRHAT